MGANAVTTVPVYTAGEVLTAADMNITNSGIPVFATTTTRDAAFGGTGEKTLAEGQFAYIEATNSTQFYDGSAWQAVAGGKVAQVVTTVKTDTFSTTLNTWNDVTGMTVTITPTASTSKILVLVNLSAGVSGDVYVSYRLVRGSTVIDAGDAAGIRPLAFASFLGGSNGAYAGWSPNTNFLDSPATTSATTYKIQTINSTGTSYLNRSGADVNDTVQGSRSASNITVMEILA